MWLLFGSQLFVSLILYVIFTNIRKNLLDRKEALIAIPIMTAISVVTIIFVHAVALSAVIINSLHVVTLALLAHRKNKILSLSIVYGLLAVIISLMAANVTNVILSVVHILTDGFIDIGLDAVTGNIVMTIIYIIFVFVIGFAISKRPGIYLYKRLRPLDEELKRKLSIYILYGATITLGIFFVHTFLRYAIDDFTILTLSYAVTLAIGFAYLVFAIFAFADNIRMELDLRHKDELLKTLQSYTERVDSISTELKQFRHDHRNLMLGFHTYIAEQNLGGLKEYYDKYITEFTTSSDAKNIFMESLNMIQIPEVKSILSAKCVQAEQQGVDVDIVVEVRDSVTVKDAYILLDLCRVVGILLDNAVEACQEVEGAVVRILVTNKDNNAYFVFTNTCATLPPINDIFNKGFSTKGDGRGLGLYKVSQILAQNNHITLNTNAKKGFFIQELTVSDIIPLGRGI